MTGPKRPGFPWSNKKITSPCTPRSHPRPSPPQNDDYFQQTLQRGAGAAPADVTSITASKGLTITAANSGADYNNVAVKFVDIADSGVANAVETASYDKEQKVLTVTYNSAASTAPSTFDEIVTAIGTVKDSDNNALFNATAGSGAGNFKFTANAPSLDTGTTGGEVLAADVVF